MNKATKRNITVILNQMSCQHTGAMDCVVKVVLLVSTGSLGIFPFNSVHTAKQSSLNETNETKG